MIQEEIIFSANEYIQRYETILKEYLNKNFNEFNEQDFITYQINRYKKYHDWKSKTKLYNILEDGEDIFEEKFFLKEFYKKADYMLNMPDKKYTFNPSDDTFSGKYYNGEYDDYLITNLRKIVEFLEEQLKNINNIEKNGENLIDLSDSKSPDKIIFLQKLGVLDFLKKKYPFNISTNSLASVISGITGEKITTIQPMLNSIISNKTVQKNNPLNSKKAVNRVVKALLNIGYNLNKSN